MPLVSCDGLTNFVTSLCSTDKNARAELSTALMG